MINENDAEYYMNYYQYYDRDDMFPDNIRTMEDKRGQSICQKNPYLLSFLTKNYPDIFY